MAPNISVELAVLRFDGERFGGHALDVECTRELLVYRNIVLECAKELWRRKNPIRERLPRKFEDGFRVQFEEVRNGSAAIPLRRVRPTDQTELDWGNLDEFDEAAQLVDEAIVAANSDQLLPSALPSNVVPLFRDFGKTLAADEVLYTKARHSLTESAYTLSARERLNSWVAPTYEDQIDINGEVRMAQIGTGGNGNFSILPDDGAGTISGRFTADQESLVLDALRNHRVARLRIKGVGEFETHNRLLKRIVRVDEASQPPTNVNFDDSATPIWDQLSAIGEAAAPRGAWDSLPDDMSTRIDDIVYRRAAGS
jgi:hypothetical protein